MKLKTVKSNGEDRLTPVSKTRGQINRLLSAESVVTIPEFRKEFVKMRIVGITPLICHNWSAKAVRMMLDKQMGIPSEGRENKNPFEDFEGSLYPLRDAKDAIIPGRWGFPAPGFKAAAVTAANDIKLKMTEMRRAFHVNWYTVPIDAPPIHNFTEWDNEYKDKLDLYHKQGISMRLDMVRLETGVADLRFRGWFPEWSAVLEIEYCPSVVSLQQLTALFNRAGDVGVGEWRPGAPKCKSGEFGRFKVG